MKTFLWFWTGAVLLAAFLSISCTEEQAHGVVCVGSRLSIVPLVDSSSVGAKSAFTGDPAEIADWCLLQFEGGVLTAKYYQPSGADMTDIAVIAGCSYEWYAVANVGDVRGQFTVGVTTVADMESWRVTGIDMTELSAVPMAWHGAEIGFTAAQIHGGSVLPVRMKRLVGKVDIVLDKSALYPGTADAGFSFTATSVSIKGPTSVRAFAGSNAVGVVTATDAASTGDVKALNRGSAVTFFAAENMNGNLLPGNTDAWNKKPASIAAAGAHPSFVEIAGTVGLTDGSGLAVPITYRCYLGKDATTNFDVERNVAHTVTLVLTESAIESALQLADEGTPTALWKIEAGSYADTRRLSWADGSLSLRQGGAVAGPVVKQPVGMAYSLSVDERLLQAGVRVFTDAGRTVEVTPSSGTEAIAVDSSTETLYFTAEAASETVTGLATISTLDGRKTDDLRIRIVPSHEYRAITRANGESYEILYTGTGTAEMSASLWRRPFGETDWEEVSDASPVGYELVYGDDVVVFSGNTALAGSEVGLGLYRAVYEGVVLSAEYCDDAFISTVEEEPLILDHLEVEPVLPGVDRTTIPVGETTRIRCRAIYTNGDSDLLYNSDVEWWSSNPDIATIAEYSSLNQQVTGISAGVARMTASYGGMSAYLDITVEAGESSYAYVRLVIQGDTSVDVGATTGEYTGILYTQAFVGGLPSGDPSDSPVTLSSISTGDSGVASVDPSTRTATGLATGTTRIGGSYSGEFGTVTASMDDCVELTVNDPVVSYDYQVTIDPTEASLSAGGSLVLTATLLRRLSGSGGDWEAVTSSPEEFLWTSGNTSLATVDAGLVTGCNGSTASGSTSVTAVYAGTGPAAAQGLSASSTLTVRGKVLQSIYVPDAYASAGAPSNALAYGETISFVCLARYDYGEDEDVTADAGWGYAWGTSHSANAYTCVAASIPETGTDSSFRVTYGGEEVVVSLMLYPKYAVALEVIFGTEYAPSENVKPRGKVSFNDGTSVVEQAGGLDYYTVSEIGRTYVAGDDIDMGEFEPGGPYTLSIYYSSYRYGTLQTLTASCQFWVRRI